MKKLADLLWRYRWFYRIGMAIGLVITCPHGLFVALLTVGAMLLFLAGVDYLAIWTAKREGWEL